MLSRYEQEKSGIAFPEEWTKKLQKLLTSLYLKEVEKRQQEFSVFALGYANEILLVITLADKEAMGIPVSYFASCDLDTTKEPMKQLDAMADSVGVFFDQYFTEENWDDFIDIWTEAEVKKQKFFYKVVRENAALTLEADRLLAENN